MKKVNCKGTELSLLSCEHAGFAKHYGCKKSVVLHCESVTINEEDVSHCELFLLYYTLFKHARTFSLTT